MVLYEKDNLVVETIKKEDIDDVIYLFNSTILMSTVLAKVFAIHENQNKFMLLFHGIIQLLLKS